MNYVLDGDDILTSIKNVGTVNSNDCVASTTSYITTNFVDINGLERFKEIIDKKIDDMNKRLLKIEDHQPTTNFTVLRGYNYEN